MQVQEKHESMQIYFLSPKDFNVNNHGLHPWYETKPKYEPRTGFNL